MGYNISPIANHNLNTVNVKALAYDLISRLDVNIEYGYYGLSEYFQLLGSEMNDDFIKLGEITKDESFETYKLIDEKYQIKQLYEKFGDDIFYNPKYWIHFDCELPDEKTIIEEKKEVNHSIYSLELVSNKEFKYLTIYDHSFLNVIPYISKWWTFCRIFTDKYYEDKDFLLSLNDNRKELMYYTLKLGGNKIYYISDQSDVLKGVGKVMKVK